MEINSIVELGASLGLNSVLVRRDGLNSVKIGDFIGHFIIPAFKVHNLVKNVRWGEFTHPMIFWIGNVTKTPSFKVSFDDNKVNCDSPMIRGSWSHDVFCESLKIFDAKKIGEFAFDNIN